MQLFYTTDIQGDLAYLPEAEARHCVQVLRHQPGDELQWVDGSGNWYVGTIVEVAKKRCVLQITEKKTDYQARSVHLHLAVAPPKNIDRFEWLLEKTTEIGIDRITPLLCQHSERRNLRLDRLEKILVSAMKQSLKAQLPQLDELTTFTDFMRQDIDPTAQKFIAHCAEGPRVLLKDNYLAGQNVILLIGPEGDFSTEEIELALTSGYQAVSLGKSRLRTETAGMVGCHTVNLMNED